MPKFVIQFGDSVTTESCGICQQLVAVPIGPRLHDLEQSTPVCRDCAKKNAPQLAALIELSQIAERVGRVCAHCQFGVPMETHLELARASERYFLSCTNRKAA